MKWFILFFMILTIFAAGKTKLKTIVDRIEKIEWKEKEAIITLDVFEKPITISKENHLLPCLQNAQLSSMSVLLTLDPDVPMITECSLYSDSFPVTSPKKILKR